MRDSSMSVDDTNQAGPPDAAVCLNCAGELEWDDEEFCKSCYEEANKEGS